MALTHVLHTNVSDHGAEHDDLRRVRADADLQAVPGLRLHDVVC